MNQQFTSICLLHPHPIELRGVEGYLESLGGFSVLYKVGNVESLFERSWLEEAQVIVAFFERLPEKTDWIVQAREQWPKVAIMASTMKIEVESLRDYLRAGLTGCIGSDIDAEEFERALRLVAEGKQYYSYKVMLALAEVSGEPGRIESRLQSKSLLSSREVEILKLVANEYSSLRIANELCISDKTVETHRRNLFQKLGVKNSIGLTKAAVRLGLV